MKLLSKNKRFNTVVAGVITTTLLWLEVPQLGPAEEIERRLSVIHNPSYLSVEAKDTSLPELLQEIGAKVGFAVVDMGISRSSLTVSITRKALEEILRQLLQGENHAIVYRGQKERQGGVSGAIDTILRRRTMLMERLRSF